MQILNSSISDQAFTPTLTNQKSLRFMKNGSPYLASNESTVNVERELNSSNLKVRSVSATRVKVRKLSYVKRNEDHS